MSTALAKIDFTQDEMAVIRRQFFPASGTPEEQNYCFSVARHLGLNPITKEIFFVPRRQKVGNQWVEKIEPMVGRDGFLSIAHRSNQLAGMETTAGIREVPTMAGGQWQYRKELVAECRVWRKDSGKPFAVQVSYSEYVQKNNDGQPTRFWAEKPETMLKKVAESQALRKAFNVHGVYSPEEVGAGFETDHGEIVVSPGNGATHKAIGPEEPFPEEPLSETVEGVWPPSVPARTPAPRRIDEIAAMLAAKNIKHDIDPDNGYIKARSYNNKEFLKSLGFRWEPEIKAWVWTDVMDAA